MGYNIIMSKEYQIRSLDELPVISKAMQLSTGEIVDCLKSKEGYWYYQVPRLDQEGNEILDENDDAVLERVQIAA
jgi:hypothetical protein